MDDLSLDAIMSDFKPNAGKNKKEEREAITVWVPKNEKAKYDTIQENSNKEFSKKLKEIVIAAIAKAS